MTDVTRSPRSARRGRSPAFRFVLAVADAQRPGLLVPWRHEDIITQLDPPSLVFCQLEEIASQEIVVPGPDKVAREENLGTAPGPAGVSGERRRGAERRTHKVKVMAGQRMPPLQKELPKERGGVRSAGCHESVK